MDEISNSITLLKQWRAAMEGITAKMLPFSIDLKRAELRLGVAPYGATPFYKSIEYLREKKSLSSYMADGKYDLFVTGALHKNLEAVEKDNKIEYKNGNNAPNYANKFDYIIEGISDESNEQLIERAYNILMSEINV